VKKNKIGVIILSFLMLLNLNVGVNAATVKKVAPKAKVVTKKVVPANTKSTVTADVYSVLAKANVSTEDYTQNLAISYGDSKISVESINTKYSKTSDSCVINTNGGTQTNTVYVNYVHNPSKAEMYVYNATTKKYQKTDQTQVGIITSNKYIDKFIGLSDSSLKILVDNSTISGDNDNIKIQTKLNKTVLANIMKDVVAANPQSASIAINDLQYTIVIQKGKLTQVNAIEKIQSGDENITMNIVYKIGHDKQNVKPFKLKE
jgi:hypothetical protein